MVVDSLNGAIVQEAALLGIPAPANRLMTDLVKALEEKVRLLGRAYGVV